MLLEAISGIIAISVVFFFCSLCCYVFCKFLLTDDEKDVQSNSEVFEATHYYDPLPLSTPSPPDTIFKPTPYTFKLQNGNGVYPSGLPHAVINPAVLQYPPGHVFDQQRIPPSRSQPQIQSRRDKDRSKSPRQNKQQSILSRRRSRSRTPSPRRPKNVWSTNTDFQHPHDYYQQHHHHQRHNYQHQQPQYQQEFQRQYVQLTQEHYPVQPKHIHFQPEENLRQHDSDSRKKNHHHHHNNHKNQEQQPQYEQFMASSHATNVYTQVLPHSSPHRKHSKSHKSKSRHKEAVT